MWILALVILVVAGFAISRLGRALLVLAGLAMAAGLVLWSLNALNTERAASRSDAFLRRDALRFDDVVLETRPEGAYPSHVLRRRLRNIDTQATVRSVRVRINMFDCPLGPNGEPLSLDRCEKVGEDFTEVAANVPPRQSRDVTHQVYLPRPSFRGRFVWSYTIERVTIE